MNEMTAYCGLKCHTCGAFLATRDNDDTKRLEIAKQWSELYRADIKPQDIHCTGCLSETGPLFQHCAVCEIRQCNRAKGTGNCAHCPEYACQKLEAFFQMAPETRVRLDAIRVER